MPTVVSNIKRKKWNAVKGKIISRFGTIIECGRRLDCSDEAIRLAATGKKCPGVRAKLKEEGLLV